MTLALRAAAFVAVAFGVLTLSSGARVLFGDGAAAAGRYVPFIGMDAHRGLAWKSLAPRRSAEG